MKHNNERRMSKRWMAISIAALIIIPLTVWSVLSHDDYNHTMVRQGCHVVNTFDNGTRVWECPRDIR